VRTVYTATAGADPAALEAIFAALEQQGAAMLDRAGIPAQRRRFERFFDARYERQSYELSVPAPPRALDGLALCEIAEAFHARHRTTYGHDNRAEPVQLVSARVRAVGTMPSLFIRDRPAPAGSDPGQGHRRVWFRDIGEAKARVYKRRKMPAGIAYAGPAVIEGGESTVLVPPAWQAAMDEDGFVLLTRR
jgi:N-methylhydantoinase A